MEFLKIVLVSLLMIISIRTHDNIIITSMHTRHHYNNYIKNCNDNSLFKPNHVGNVVAYFDMRKLPRPTIRHKMCDVFIGAGNRCLSCDSYRLINLNLHVKP